MSDETKGAPKLAPFIVVPYDAARAERQWTKVRDASLAPKRRPLWPLYALACAASVVLAAWIGRRTAPRPVAFLEGMTATTADGTEQLTIEDGSEVDLAARTTVRIEAAKTDRVLMSVERGAATFDVRHVDGRSWVVHAGAFDVRVVGTRFTVARADDIVTVEVERGRVEVANHGAADARAVLGAGERWMSTGATASATVKASAAFPPHAAASVDAPPSDSSAASIDAAPSAEPVAPAQSSKPAWEELARARKFKDAYAAIGSFSSACDAADAEHLFLLAETARASGHLRDAERAFDALRTKHRGDSRAALAAFELGRLRQDALGNPSGALEALSDAIALGPSAPFREDAEARRVQALDASGAKAACAAARDAYLKKYPSSAHAAMMRSRCPSE